MVVWWLCGGYVLPVEVKPEISTFKVKFDLEGQGQSPPKTIGIFTQMFCTSGPNLAILDSMGEELWCGQPQTGMNLIFELNYTLKDKVD